MTKRLNLRDLATTEAERIEAEALQQDALNDSSVQAKARTIYERYRDSTACQLAEVKGISMEEALASIPQYSKEQIEKNKVHLALDHLVWIEGQWLTVEELLSRGAEFDGCSMADPIEGPGYGHSTAIFYYNDGNPVIHSWAHGDSTTYLLSGFPAVDGANETPPVMQDTRAPCVATPAGQMNLSKPLDLEGFPHLQGSGEHRRPKPTYENFRHLLDTYGVTVRYNVIAKETEINVPGMQGSLDNRLAAALTRIESLAALNGLSTNPTQKYVGLIADEEQFNPIAEWIDSRPWDGRDRLSEVYATFSARADFPEELKHTLIYRWLLSAVAAVFKPSGFHCRGVLTLQGPQGLGKTSWIRSLVPEPSLQEAYVLEGHHLDPSNKDSVLIAIKHWIVEMGEVDSSFKKDIARIKGVITSSSDKVRKPYAAAASEFQRRTVFAASVNEEHFLVDPTGNSRWWVIPLVKIDFQHGIDMQQVFSQLAVDYKAGQQWWLTREEEELLQSQNRWHEAVNVIEETLLERVDTALPKTDWPRMTASEVLRALGYSRPTNPQARECGGVLRKHFGSPKKINGIQKWSVPLHPSPDTFTRITGA